jgi:hypothetical protein
MGQLLQQGVSADAPKQKPTKESYRPFLRDVYLFSGFPDEALTQLLDNMQVKSLSKALPRNARWTRNGHRDVYEHRYIWPQRRDEKR